ncbi:threonine/serine dehydratase [uncultured Planktomarina sp.]|jgi:threonine dehydratase|uniref:threonine/serine dehydratase n=1 Tax=uncultured Planktomarina sp. TaxID=1538529 RepID=UPI003261CB17
MVTAKEVSHAWTRIKPHVLRTPVLETDVFGMPLSLKLEQMQHTGSFKARGAMNSLLSMDVPKAGLVAASGGNHGAAVAWAAARLGHRARIYVPELAGEAKINLIRSLGADLIVVPGVYANALEQALAYEKDSGAAQIHAFDAPGTVAGQGTVMAEWEEQGLTADTVLIAVGGGGLIGGAMAWLEGRRKLVGVEPFNAPTLTQALEHGPQTTVEVSGLAANALGAKQAGRICYDLARVTNTGCVNVEDAAIAEAQHRLWSALRLVVEPAGAAALAALLSGAYRPQKGERLAVLLCGANPAVSPFEPAKLQ